MIWFRLKFQKYTGLNGIVISKVRVHMSKKVSRVNFIMTKTHLLIHILLEAVQSNL